MRDFVLITGNQNKADNLAKWLGSPVAHHKLDLDEIQSLDLRKIVEHKVRQAYKILNRPVLVEDVALTFTAMGRLPGPLIKWFLDELGNQGLCNLVDGLEHRKAVASICYALYDGRTVHYFESHVAGTVAAKPLGTYSFGWGPIFIADGLRKTYAEMTDDEIRPYNMRAKAIDKLKKFLQKKEGL